MEHEWHEAQRLLLQCFCTSKPCVLSSLSIRLCITNYIKEVFKDNNLTKHFGRPFFFLTKVCLFVLLINNRSLANLLFLPVKGSCTVVQARTTAFITQLIHCWLQPSHQVSSRPNAFLPSQRPRSKTKGTFSIEPHKAVEDISSSLLVYQTRSG